MSKTGHAFIKERMRQEDAIYGGEMSAHHYFRDFAYCDSGMIPWLLVARLLCLKETTSWPKSLVATARRRSPASGRSTASWRNAPRRFSAHPGAVWEPRGPPPHRHNGRDQY